jgi:biopolymer transport protein ExbD
MKLGGKSQSKRRAKKLGMMGEMNTTPLIDVMLVLLVMLIITIPIQLHSVDLNLPTGNPPPSLAEPEVVRLNLLPDGSMTWNGELIPDFASLEKSLTQKAKQAEQPEIHLRPDKEVRYEKVAAVMALAQRLGLSKLGITGGEQFIQ